MRGKHHHHGNGHHHHHDHDHHHDHGPGHNHAERPKKVAQWQTPHLSAESAPREAAMEPDLDLVERAFVEGFATASDPTSFLRLAQVPFEAADAAGKRLVLLRVEADAVTDIGAVTPHLGGGSFRYDPLPAHMATRRARLRLVYFDGEGTRALTLGEAKNLATHFPSPQRGEGAERA